MKKILLIGGGGTLGTPTAEELLRLGYTVDVISLDEHLSLRPRLRYFRGEVTDRMLTELFADNRYDAIVDFLHYPEAEKYASRAALLLDHTDQLIFLSSYRTYADIGEKYITEDAPRLADVKKDDAFFMEKERYALSKSLEEDLLRNTGKRNFTIVRPVISFSKLRLDLVTVPTGVLLSRAIAHKPILLPRGTRNVTAAVGYAENVGKMIAHLVGKTDSLTHAFTLSTAENKTWGYVADCYADLLGAKFEWIDDDDYFRFCTSGSDSQRFLLYYDRLFDRRIDNSAVLSATGLAPDGFVPIHDGIRKVLRDIEADPQLLRSYLDNDSTARKSAAIDAYLAK